MVLSLPARYSILDALSSCTMIAELKRLQMFEDSKFSIFLILATAIMSFQGRKNVGSVGLLLIIAMVKLNIKRVIDSRFTMHWRISS